jgi:hypothetical protein
MRISEKNVMAENIVEYCFRPSSPEVVEAIVIPKQLKLEYDEVLLKVAKASAVKIPLLLTY